jgi:NADH-quinone oxidoreductase subunit C
MADLEDLRNLAARIEGKLPDAVRETTIVRGELTVFGERDQIVPLLKFLRDDQQCDCETFIDLCGVDYPERSERFEVVYHLLSMGMNHRVRVRIRTDEETPVPSVVGLWPAANWFEREAFDMYGIQFSDHPDLRRILTDYGFEGYPLRKDFPLTGFHEVRYDDQDKRVVYEPVNLPQEYRNFDFLSPWEGMTGQIPGDEKAAPAEEVPE